MSAAEQVKTLENRISELERENKLLHDTVEYLTRKLFGRRSEKASVLSLGQMSLFDEAETEADPKAGEPDLKQVQGYRRKKFNGQRMELLKDIPHDKRLCTLVEEDRFCEKCNTALISVGEEFIRTEIEFIPAKVRPLTITVKPSSAAPAVRTASPTWRNHQCPIRWCSILWPLPPQWPGSCIRSSSTPFLFTGRRKNGRHWA
ncbi:MAG: Transposase C of IS166 homeodomain protein [Pelotomaculum sp. PtaU1.Bin065]|nr:MAG: Transposase C of IS166 homeodomain protein [Pelotomaculum sp. PtaU1.Bin065]